MVFLKENLSKKFLFLNKSYVQIKSIITWLRTENYLYKGFYPYFFKKIKVKILKKLGFSRLDKIFIGPSFKCNANCPHCYEKFENNNLEASLTTAECKNIIDQFEKLGGYWVFFCSGEFLLRSDAFELISYVDNKGMITSVTTNGSLIDKDRIVRLKNAGLKVLIVSIDSADQSKHDSSRGVGCFKKAVNALELAKEVGIVTHIWTYMTKSHSKELSGIYELGRRIGVQTIFVYFTLLSGYLFDKFEENFTFEEKEAIRKEFNLRSPLLLEFAKERWQCRGGGREHISIAPTGDITFCPPVAYSYGNIREESLKDVLKKIEKDYKRLVHCTRGQCPINFPEYRERCNAKFMYPSN